MTRVNCAGTLLRTTLALALLVGAAPRAQAAEQDPPNGAPLVDAGPDSSGVATSPTGATLVLFGRVSDPDNDILTVTWTGNFPTIQFEVWPPYFSGNAALYARLPIGVTEATLTVDDSHGHIVSDTVIVTVAGTNTAVGTAIDMTLLDDRVAEYYGFTPGRLKLTFDSITAAGLTWMRTRTDQLFAPPDGKQLGSAPYYYDVEATSAGDGNVRVCVDSTGMSFASGHSARLHRLNGSAWDDIALPSTPVESAAHYVCGATPFFASATFALFTAADESMRVTTILDNLPSGMLTVDPARQYLYVAGGYELRRIDLQTQANIRVAGNGSTDVRYNVDALDTSFFTSGRMAVDQAGNIYAPDVNGCGVLRLEPRNNFTSYFLTRVAGQGPDPVTLTCGYGGDGGAAIDADVTVVGGLAFDRFDNLFFVQNAYAGGYVVRRIAAGADGVVGGAADEIITTIAGGGTTWPPNGNPHEVGFGGSLRSLTFSPQGDLYLGVSSQVSRLTRAPGAEIIDGRPGELIASVSGGGPLDFAPFQGDGGPARDADWFGTGSVVILPNGDLIVADSGFNRLRRISAGADGIVNGGPDEMVSTFAGFTENFSDIPFNGDGYALSTSLFYPDLVLNDPRGGLLVVDRNRLRHIGVGVATGTGADLAVTVTAPATVGAGGTIHYTVVITNNGPSPATQVGLSLPVSAANLLGVTASSPAGFCVVPLLFLVPAGTVSCDAGTLAPNASITLTVDATLRTNPLFSTVTATFTVGGHEQDIVTDNNTRTVETEIEPSVDLLLIPLAPALTGTVNVGTPVTFRMTVSNVGAAAAQTARLNFHPPAGLQFVSASMLGAFCEFVGFLVCDIDNIAPGASVDALVVVTPLASGPVTATFTISSPTIDVDLSNNAITFNVNRTPLANAGADQNIAINPTTGTADFAVSSAGSSDPDGDPLVFTWSRNGELLGTFPAVSQILPIGNYVYTLTANDGRGGVATDTVEVIVHGTGLAAPTNVSALATGPGTVTISWNPVPGASGYRILRSPDPVTLQIPVEPPVHVMIGSPVTFDVTGTSTVDSGLPTLVRQYYAVQAINGAIVSLPTPAQGGEVMVTAEPDAEIFGVADFHNHQFANLGFGRSLIWGSAFSPAGILNALPTCEAVHGSGGLLDLIGNFKTTPPGSFPVPIPITVPSITFTPPNEPPITTPSLFPLLTSGHYTDGITANNNVPFRGWPRWNSITHQQVYYEWLKRAFDGGLRLMVMHALNNKLLCQISGTVNQTLGNFSCNDMDNIDDQLNMAKSLEAFVDGQSGGPGKGWYRIAYSATEARHIINSGKMAVILGVEVDDLFGCSLPSACTEQFVRDRLNHYYNMGVRHLFPVHVFDNAFAGTALYSSLFDVGNRLVEGQFVERRECNPEGYGYKALPDPLASALQLPQAAVTTFIADCNARPLQPLGDFLIREMMAKGMIIDIDHMSASTAHLVMARAEQYGYAGIMTGHSGSSSVLQGAPNSEGAKTPAQLARIRAIGGVSGIFAGQGDRVRSGNLNGVRTHPGSTVVNDCGNSSKTFAQVYLATVDALGGPGTASVGFGTDFNGLASMPGPRFGSESCWGDSEQSPQSNRVIYPFAIATRPGVYAGRLGQPTSPLEPPPNVRQKTWDINEDGLAHVGMLPDFIQELRNVGVTETQLQPLFRSAEGYIRMWERAEATAPMVTPPANISIASTESAGARGNASTELQSFLLGGSAIGFGSVTRLAPQVGGVVANDQTLFPLGATEVTFRFSDSAGHIGSATATVTVVQGSGTIVIDDGVDVNLFADGGSLIGTLRFSDVQQEGFVTATVLTIFPALPIEFEALTPVYDIVTTAISGGVVDVCLNGSGFQPDDRLLHHEGGAWTDVTSGVSALTICGQVTSLSPFVAVRRVNRPPTANAGSYGPFEATSPSGASVTLIGSGSDPDTSNTLTFVWTKGATTLGNNATITAVLPIGTHDLTLTVSDNHGLSATSSTQVIVRDTTPPNIVAPPNQSASTASAGGVAVTYPPATATDTASGVQSVQCAPASGSVFPIGATTVTCTATDLASNASTATFTVTVQLTPTLDGRMFGIGFIAAGSQHHHLLFHVMQRDGIDSGRLEYWFKDSRLCGEEDDFSVADGSLDNQYGHDHAAPKRFQATAITEVIVTDDPAFRPGWALGGEPQGDTVRVQGTGTWNGEAGYTFEMLTSDRGEPGRNRDRFSLVIKNASGQTVASVNATLGAGNVQAANVLR